MATKSDAFKRGSGYNPLRWDCDRDGCFNKKRRPKIEVFYDCFPGKINFGDVDGLVEWRNKFCLLEWKGDGGELRTAQRIAFERFTESSGNIVFVVHGNPETMEVEKYGYYFNGKFHSVSNGNLEKLKILIRRWVESEIVTGRDS